MTHDNAVAGSIGRQDEPPEAPDGLSPGARQLWTNTLADFPFGSGELPLLEAACRAWSRAEEAREVLRDEGLTTVAGSGMSHPHPAARLERDALKEFRLCWAKLGMIDPESAGK